MKTCLKIETSLFCTLVLLLYSQTATLTAQNKLLGQAQELMSARSYTRATHLYNRIIEQEPDNVEALRNRAIIYSWNKQHKEAAGQFDTILKDYPQDISTLNAAAYNLAWWGNYVRAESLFRKVVVIDYDNNEAWKGLAYVALWKGHGKLAINRFNRLLGYDSHQSDLKIGLGHAYLLAGQHRKARKWFDESMTSTDHSSAQELLTAVQATPGWFELSVWGGMAKVEDQQSWGLRTIEIAFQPYQKLRLWARYDNSLTLENLALIRNRSNADGYFIGASHQWNKRLLTKLEVGSRHLEELGGRQKLIQIEQLAYLRNQASLKVGYFTTQARSSEDTWTIYGGVGLPLLEGWTLEPVYYYTQPQHSNHHEHRAQLNSYLSLNKAHQINVGLFGGYQSLSERKDHRLYGALLGWVIPTAKRHWTTVMLRYESGIEEIMVASLGFKYRVER